MNKPIPTYDNIVSAHKRIRSFVHHTPVLTSSAINSIVHNELFFKCENLQKVGAFKFRGATNAVLSLNSADLNAGVATHSSGNHAAALALAARTKGVPAYIVMPETSPDIKKQAVEGYGAKITFCKPTLEARESTLEEIVKHTGATFIHPYDNFNVVCGQGTAAKELLETKAGLDVLITPVGGGGLLSGSSVTARALNPEITIIGAEPENADDAFRSFRDGTLYPSVSPKTIADGLLTSLSEFTFKIIRQNVDELITASEEFIALAMRMVWERMKIIIEPSSALPLAILLQHAKRFKNKKIGIILSGGNVDLNNLNYLFSAGKSSDLTG